MLKLTFHGALSEIWEGLTLVQERLCFCLAPDGIPVTVEKLSQGLSMEVNSQGYRIGYHTKPEFFRALALLTDRLSGKTQTDSITETPRFDTCGAMIDVSRNAVLRVDTVKDMIQRMALMGLNMLMLYTEDTYKMDAYGGTGETFDRTLIPSINKPFFLAGGLGEDNVQEAIRQCAPYAVDVSSSVETEGSKDVDKIVAFVKKVRSYRI